MVNAQTPEQLQRLRYLVNDFVSISESFARVIISEQFLPDLEKTIRPLDSSGHGGSKYLHKSILFKFCVDTQKIGQSWIFGGDKPSPEFARKSGCHELIGASYLFDCGVKDLHLPLLATIDFLGFRVVAVSQLPIDSSTLVYGSDDGGSTVHNIDARAADAMKKVANSLNLSCHVVRNQEIWGPGDIEIHKSFKDGKLYIIDFSRLFPPEHPGIGPPQSVFYNFLRPEFVLQNKEPLCSDAFTAWNTDPMLNDQVVKATLRLHQDIIPEFAKKISAPNVFLSAETATLLQQLNTLIHQHGINFRHMGYVRSHLVRPLKSGADTLLLIEMISRVLKNEMNNELQSQMARIRSPSHTAYRSVAMKQLNRIVYGHDDFWTHPSQVKSLISKRFGRNSLTDRELQPTFHILENISSRRELLDRFCLLCGLEVQKRFLETLKKDPTSFIESDFSFKPKIKYMSVIDRANAKSYIKEVTNQTPDTLAVAQSHLRMLGLAENHIINGLRTTPSSKKLRRMLLEVQFEQIKKTEKMLQFSMRELNRVITEMMTLKEVFPNSKKLIFDLQIAIIMKLQQGETEKTSGVDFKWKSNTTKQIKAGTPFLSLPFDLSFN